MQDSGCILVSRLGIGIGEQLEIHRETKYKAKEGKNSARQRQYNTPTITDYQTKYTVKENNPLYYTQTTK